MTLTKEEFKDKFEEARIRKLERDIFEELKDSPAKGTAYIEKKYQGSGIDAGKINRWIINYQVKVYGETIPTHSEDDFRSSDEYYRKINNIKSNKRKKIKR